mgnify:CR=1 FL=1
MTPWQINKRLRIPWKPILAISLSLCISLPPLEAEDIILESGFLSKNGDKLPWGVVFSQSAPIADPTGKTALDRKFNQIAADVLYRFGAKENVYLGARYNMVKGNMITSSTTEQSISRIAIAGGWFVTDNVMIKAEYVTQSYKDYPVKNIFSEGKFDGVVFEAAVGF